MGRQLPLTERQKNILAALGYASPQIAERLRITQKTVDTHKARIYNKLDLQGIVEVVWYAVSNNLVSIEDYDHARALRFSTQKAFHLTEEQRAKHRPKNPNGGHNGGRPPAYASPGQLATWRKDMERRKGFHKFRPVK